MLQSLVGPVVGLLDKFIEDKDAKNALAHEINTMATRQAQELAKGQLEVDKVEPTKVKEKKGIEEKSNKPKRWWEIWK